MLIIWEETITRPETIVSLPTSTWLTRHWCRYTLYECILFTCFFLWIAKQRMRYAHHQQFNVETIYKCSFVESNSTAKWLSKFFTFSMLLLVDLHLIYILYVSDITLFFFYFWFLFFCSFSASHDFCVQQTHVNKIYINGWFGWLRHTYIVSRFGSNIIIIKCIILSNGSIWCDAGRLITRFYTVMIPRDEPYILYYIHAYAIYLQYCSM